MDLPSDPSPSVKKLNPHLFGTAVRQTESQSCRAAKAEAKDIQITSPLPAVPLNRNQILANVFAHPSCAEKELNKAEKLYLLHLRTLYKEEQIGIQSVSFRIAKGCSYHPDFIIAPDENGHVVVVDVKAKWKNQSQPHVEDDALVKMKACAVRFRWCIFKVVWKDGVTWKERIIEA